ncbi:MAG: hypothetical protein HY962_02375, partial [Ignavibacteriae bacterium]|nr:hypothetical protein [Ignavibacteriota bacterium]
MKTVTAPGEGKPDITMSYAGKRAITIHKAPPGVEVSDPLDLAIPTAPVTIQAVDGLGQPVWTAKTAVVDGAPTYAVANRALKDGLGRPRVAGLVQAVSFAALASLVTADASPALFAPTRTDVDDKDRPTYVYEPQAAPSEASRVSRKEYSAANGRLRTDAYDAKNNHTATVQDSAGNTVEVWEYNGAEIGTVTYVFDALKQVTRIEDAERPNPNVTTITYDGLGRQSSVTTPDTGTTTFEYDSVGRLKK